MMQCMKLSTLFSDDKAELSEFLSEWKINKRYNDYLFPACKEDVSVTDDIEVLKSFSKIIPKESYNRFGIMRKNQDGWIDVTQAL